MSDSEESLPDLVASSSSECESDDEVAAGKGAKASVSACCSLCAHARAPCYCGVRDARLWV